MTRQKEFAESLRQLADWYEKQPDTTPVPVFPSFVVWYYEDGEKAKSLAIEIAHALGDADKEYISDGFYLKRHFGQLRLSFRFQREAVCTRRVVGVKEVEEEIYVKTGRKIQQEVYEWDCHPLLGATDEKTNPDNR